VGQHAGYAWGASRQAASPREEAAAAFPLDDNPYMKNAFLLAPERDLIPRLRGENFFHNQDKPRTRLDMALENVARVYTAGAPIGLGTDSGFKMKLRASLSTGTSTAERSG
jgi:hypothetical protein